MAKWLMRGDCVTVWYKCSNCHKHAPVDENGEDILTDRCPNCNEKMENGCVGFRNYLKG